jgi:LEA14-like dessication related protein
MLTFMLLTGCSAMVQKPVVTVKDLNVVSLDPGGAGMELRLNVENKNRFDITMQGYSYNLDIMTLPLAKGGAREEIRFPANAATDLRIPIRISFSDLLEILKQKPDFDKIPYHVTAGLDVDTPVGQLTVPIDREGTYAIPKEYRPSNLLNSLTNFLRIGK